MDALNIKLRMVVREAWKNLAGQQAFKGVVINQELRDCGLDEFSLDNQIRNRMACGTSATRLCEILAGTPMSDIMTSAEAIAIDAPGLADTLAAMSDTDYHFIVRINVVGGGAGHSYVFLSKLRKRADPLLGYIYQTNVGCHVSNAFGLNDWVADDKSLQEVDLVRHLQAVAKRLCGIDDPTSMDPNGFYKEAYLLSSREMHQGDTSEIEKMAKQEGTRANARIMWRAVDADKAMKRLGAILDAKMFGKVKA